MTFQKSKQITVMDLDLTRLGNLVMTANQAYTIGGLTLTKFNSANELLPAVFDATGLSFYPASTSDYNGATRTIPGIHIPFFRFIPGFRDDMGVRVWAYVSENNATTSFDNPILAVDTNSTAYGYVMKRGFGTVGQGVQVYLGANAVNASGFISDNVTSSAAGNVTSHVMVLEIPSITSSQWRSFRGTWNGSWPKMEELTQHNSYTFSATVNTTGVTPQSLGVVLGGQRAGSGTAYYCRFARLRVDLV